MPEAAETNSKTTKAEIFDFDELEALVEQYHDHSGEKANASLRYGAGRLLLLVGTFRDFNVQVFQVAETPELYQKMEAKYIEILENRSSGDDFSDKWDAVMEVMTDYKIIDESLNP